MATSSSRDIKFKVGVDVAGDGGIDKLREGVEGLSDAGKAASPEFERMAAELEAASAATKKFRAEEAAAKTEVAAAKAALIEQREALERARLTTSAAEKATDEFKASQQASRLAILDATKSLRDKQAALASATTATRAAAAAQKSLTDQLAAMQQPARTVTTDLRNIGDQLRTIQVAAGTVLGGQLLGGMLGDVAKTADAFANLSARVKLAAGDGDAFKAAMQGVFDVAQRTSTSLDSVADLYTKLATAGKQIGVTNAQALAITETISQAVQLSGVAAESANAALVQLVQGLSSGTLRGEELNSVLEQAPRLARALADGLGVTTGELRKLGEAGSLTSQQVISALQGQAATLRSEFGELPQTIGRAVTNLNSAWSAYVGQVDKATGASATVAGVINSLAKNLETVATVLIDVGKATAAYQALKLAQTFTGIGTAARVATADVAAFGAAQAAAGSAAAGYAANVGKMAAALSTLKTFSLIGVATNLKDIGTWLGESVAKWQGYGKVMHDAEGRMRAAEAASRALAEANAAQAQKAQIAADKALGLSTVAQALVAAFTKATDAGDTTADALGKVAKAMDLSNPQGIQAAGAALDALAVRGKITGDQLRDTLASALKTEDLGKFETEARAAFDSSEIGARRFAAAVDAGANEALRRAGLSVQELRTGFGAAASSAINDVDALAGAFDRLGAKGPETGVALAKALDKATEAAGTERALQAVIDRYETLGKSGRLSGDQVAAGLEKARAKIDELVPGVNTLNEALRNFGLKTQTELQTTASKFAASWEAIRNSTTTALGDKIKAFEQYAEAARAANAGVESEEIKVQREMLRMQAEAARTGDAFERHMGRAAQAVASVAQDAGIIGPNQDVHSVLTKDTYGGADNTGLASLVAKQKKGQLTADDLKTAEAALTAAETNNEVLGGNRNAFSLEGQRSIAESLTEARRIRDDVQRIANTKTVNVNLNGRKTPINVASDQDSNNLVGLLRQLETASGTASGAS